MIIKILLMAACSISGFYIAYSYKDQFNLSWYVIALIGLLSGFLVTISVIRAEQAIRKVSLRVIFGGVFGMLIGLVITVLLAYGINFVGVASWEKQQALGIYILLAGIMGYLGLVIGSKKIEELSLFGFGQSKESSDYGILDTSVIIDGRIADICDTGFIEGTLVVPRFVLDELQYIADSSDSMKRSRGRRGLDILNRMQRSNGIDIEVVDQDFPKLKGVDAKLVAMAKKMNARIITNDFNLNKVAELQGIKILNVNELANALKPVVLPGEIMTVKIIKEGKEPGQGVAYLDDGTMIIVDHAQKYQGSTVDVTVTSVLQTTAGRMIFSEMKEAVNDKKTYGFSAKQ